MRLRVYRRKVLALLLALAAAALGALALWGHAGGGGEEGGGRREEAGAAPPPARASPPSASPPPPPAPGPRRNASLSLPWWEAAAAAAAAAAEDSPWPSGPNATLRLRALIYRLNFDQPLRNAEKWRPPAAGAGASPEGAPWVALVVQVHARAEHLALLLGSLRRAPGAERVLLVLSHDVWDPALNALAARVDFCAVAQVFFPFSLQLYPGEFPGADPRDCPRDLGRAAALRRGCLNARFPDAFGHYREAAFAQAKHHWWWKLHFAWERLRALRGLPEPGLLLFLEEDHFLAPDFLAVLRRLWALRQAECPQCQVLSLGSYAALRPEAFAQGGARKAELKTWRSTEHNMGLAFPRETYRALAACADAFCAYDDYNWDWTLQHLTVGCLPRFWKVLVPQVPRVFHTGGDCGMHHPPPRKAKAKAGDPLPPTACRPGAQTRKLEALLEAHRGDLFPEDMTLSKRFPLAPLSPHVKNGGWGDVRDHELCKSYRRLQ